MKLVGYKWDNGLFVHTLYHTQESGKREVIQFGQHANKENGWWVNTHNVSLGRCTRQEVIALIRSVLRIPRVVKPRTDVIYGGAYIVKCTLYPQSATIIARDLTDDDMGQVLTFTGTDAAILYSRLDANRQNPGYVDSLLDSYL